MRRLEGWAILPRTWDNTFWWSGVDIADRVTGEGLYVTRDAAREFCKDGEAVVRVKIYLERDGGH